MKLLIQFLQFFSLLSIGLGEWIQASNGHIPRLSLIGGFDVDNQDLYICRADGVNGKLSRSPGLCRYAWRGEEIERRSYQVLTNVHSVWVPVTPPYFPSNQLMGSVSNGDPVYICRVLYIDRDYNKSLTIGKVDQKKAFIGYGNKELKCDRDLSCDNYEVLTEVPKIPENVVYALSGKYLTFRVNAGGTVRVLLGVDGIIRYIVNIGELMNSASSINKVNFPYKVVQKTEGILDNMEMKGYWLRWTSNNILEFGVEGKTLPLISYNDVGVHEIDSVQFSPIEGNQWQIPNLFEF